MKVVVQLSMTGKEKFQTLLTQLNITDELDKEIVGQGELTRINVSQSKRIMAFLYKVTILFIK